ncbi:hypothetical protein F511_38127 [Dorcoceras hygrometricum]|uniref:Uncharacterized protein n=1 Tax=Dorcoceras hygrometricum TaxID=472368 RepID=A0A2Z7DI09_9LAMI|nr:hypothetical protein F511_38127 [Dorcoceras hygrometricum]
MVLTNKPKSYAEAIDTAIDIEEGLQNLVLAGSSWRRLIVLLFRERSLHSPPSQPISPSSSSRWLSSLAVRGFDHEVSSSRRSRVLALLVQAVRVAVDLGLSFAAFAVESILPRSVLVCSPSVPSSSDI